MSKETCFQKWWKMIDAHFLFHGGGILPIAPEQRHRLQSLLARYIVYSCHYYFNMTQMKQVL
jgi:hypothetical protein